MKKCGNHVSEIPHFQIEKCVRSSENFEFASWKIHIFSNHGTHNNDIFSLYSIQCIMTSLLYILTTIKERNDKRKTFHAFIDNDTKHAVVFLHNVMNWQQMEQIIKPKRFILATNTSFTAAKEEEEYNRLYMHVNTKVRSHYLLFHNNRKYRNISTQT